MADWRATDALSAEEEMVIEYAEVLTATPADVPDELYDRLRDTLGEKALVELTHLIAWENCRARFNRGFRIEPDGYNTPTHDH